MERPYPYKAKNRIESLISTLRTLIERDPEQEVLGLALPVLAAALADVKGALPEDPVVQQMVDIFSADFIGLGDPIRAAEILLIAEQLDAAIGHYPAVIA